MKPYPEYKETGLSWLPKIPKHWEVRKIKYLFDERSEKGHFDEPLLAATQNRGVIPKDLYEARTVVAQKDLYLLKLVHVGDFVISLRSFQGGIEYAYHQGIISPAYTIMVPKSSDLDSDYFRFLAKSKPFIELLKTCVTGIREGQNIDYSALKRNSLPLPPIAGQKKIVRYLDVMTAKIDTLIDAKKKQIALKIERLNSYLFSEKGATHLGWWETCFPSHWNLEKARRIFVERNQKGYSDRELLAVTQDQGILYKKDCPQHFVEPGDTKTQKLVCTGDCVISLRSFQGGVETSDFEGLVSAAYSVFYMKKTDLLLSNYYRYLFKTPAFIAYLNTLVRDIRDGKKIGFDDFRECFLPIPPAAHLEKIKGFVDEIEILKKSLYNEQKLLREYKDSLISSIVTGRVEVPVLKSF